MLGGLLGNCACHRGTCGLRCFVSSPMKTLHIIIAAVLMCSCSAFAKDDGGFHSIAEYRAGDPNYIAHLEYENIDDLFDTQGIVKRLTQVKRVRIFRRQGETEDLLFAYWELQLKGALRERHGRLLPTIELAEKDFRPILNLASDFNNYGDTSACGFEAGVAILIGDNEPDFILVCCFKCHDVHIIRRPTSMHPMPQIAEVGMSPELETAIFELMCASYPNDKELQSFKLAKRHRSKTPIEKPRYFEDDTKTSKPRR